jgi:tetratricopeptide (TPR) repeat protein
LPKALDCYKQAVQLDPGYADALAALATTYVMITMGWDALPAHDTMPKARTAAKQALELEPNLAEAHTALGMVSMYYDWDLVRAEQSFKEALRLNPNSVEAHIWYVGLLIWLDTRYEEALSHLRHATQLDPVDLLGQVMAGFVYQFSRDFNGAIDHAGRIVALDPLYGFGHYHLGCALVLAGRTNEAIASFERAMELAGRGATFVALSGLAYAVAGQKERALACLDELVAYERAGKNVAAWKVHVSAGLGDADQVISDLEQAVDERASSTLFLFTAPYLDFVRQDPRFIALLRRAGLERLAKYRGYPEWYPPNVPRPAA